MGCSVITSFFHNPLTPLNRFFSQRPHLVMEICLCHHSQEYSSSCAKNSLVFDLELFWFAMSSLYEPISQTKIINLYYVPLFPLRVLKKTLNSSSISTGAKVCPPQMLQFDSALSLRWSRLIITLYFPLSTFLICMKFIFFKKTWTIIW